MLKTRSRTFFLLGVMSLLASCEGFKVLTVHNRTGHDIVVQTKPELPVFKHTMYSDAVQRLSDVKEYRVFADSSLTLLARFGWLLFNGKIKEKDLVIDYLKITSSEDTISADNRSDIVNLIRNKTRNRKKADNAYALSGHRNFKIITVKK